MPNPIDIAAQATPPSLARKVRGLSDRTIAWIFVAPTIFLLLAINIFPLIWTIRLSFTNYAANKPNAEVKWVGIRNYTRILTDEDIWSHMTTTAHFLIWTIRLSFTNYAANKPNAEVKWVGIRNYTRILTDEDIWSHMTTTAHFLIWTIVLQVIIGFTLAWLINRKFKGNDLLTTLIVVPMMLSPAVVGNFWTFLYQPQIGMVNYIVEFFTGIPAASFSMLGPGGLAPWSIIIVDTWMWTPFVMLICLAGLRSIPDYIYEAAEVDRASKWRQFWTITVPMVLPFLMLAVLFRGIENFKMFDMVNLLTGGGPGDETLLTSIDLKREAFEKWRTGYSSAYAIILFVTVFGLASIYVKALNKVKER